MADSIEDNIISLGKVIGAFGIHGYLKVKTDTDIAKYPLVLLQVNNSWISYKLERSSIKGSLSHIKLIGIDDRTQALGFVGCYLGVNRKDLAELTDDEYYWVDLIGLTVYNQAGVSLGKVNHLLETGANAVLVISGTTKQHLIPFINQFIIDVDLTNKKLIVYWDEDY